MSGVGESFDPVRIDRIATRHGCHRLTGAGGWVRTTAAGRQASTAIDAEPSVGAASASFVFVRSSAKGRSWVSGPCRRFRSLDWQWKDGRKGSSGGRRTRWVRVLYIKATKSNYAKQCVWFFFFVAMRYSNSQTEQTQNKHRTNTPHLWHKHKHDPILAYPHHAQSLMM